MEKLVFAEKVEYGLKQLDEAKTVIHGDVKEIANSSRPSSRAAKEL